MSIYKIGSVVIVLQGRFAGKKAVVVNVSEKDGVLVAGMSSYPKKATQGATPEVNAKRATFKNFLKLYNPKHIMPTRYNLKHDLQNVAKASIMKDATLKKKAKEAVNKYLQDSYNKSGETQFLFSKLRF